MRILIILLFIIFILPLVYVITTYNSLVSLRNKVKEAFATMDVYLKKRWDLIPNLVETVRGYAKHELDTLENVIKLRAGVYDYMTTEGKIDTNQQITDALSKIIALAESYPDLKANQNYLDLSNQLARVEEDIANSRKYYNAVVRMMNNKVQMFPSSIIAGMSGFEEERFFEANESERESIKVEMT